MSMPPEESFNELLGDEYVMERRLLPGSGRMMRTFLCHHRQTREAVVVKSIWIRSEDVALLKEQEKELLRIKTLLKGQAHVAPFLQWNMGDLRLKQPGNLQILPITLMRSHLYTTLSDRLESRPFLTHVEKLWILSQLLEALQALHDCGVVHGFITSTQIGITSWGHVVLLDIASYKSLQTLPDDDPSLYLYYFQELQQDPTVTGCYLAPERFHSKTESSTPFQLTPQMDVFSAGCVFLETSLNGERALDLGDLMDLRKGKEPVGLQQRLQKIESSSLRAACKHMLHVDPEQRLSAREYLERLEIPKSFGALKQLMARMNKETPDARVALAAAYYGDILRTTMGLSDKKCNKYFRCVLGKTLWEREHPEDVKNEDSLAYGAESEPTDLMAETEALLKQLDTLNFDDDSSTTENIENIPVKEANEEALVPTSATDKKALLIYLQLVLSNLRFVQRPSSKLVALHILDLVARVLNDEALLQRILPTTISLLQDQDPLVKAKAVMVMTDALALVQSFPPSDSKIFPQYIFKRVAHLISDSSLVVRVAFAGCMAKLAETAHRFLDISHAVRLYEVVGGGTGTSTPIEEDLKLSGIFGDDVTRLLDKTRNVDGEYNDSKVEGQSSKAMAGTTLIRSTYNFDLAALHETVSRWVLHITADQAEHSSPPKRALLKDLTRLCNFFGRDGVMAFILPQILAFLNDRRDWQLRAALFSDLPSVCYMIGRAATEHFVLPCLETALVDGEDQVMSQALLSLAALVDMGLLSRSVLVEPSKNDSAKTRGLFEKYSPLLIYPSSDVRQSAIALVNSSCIAVGFPDSNVFLVPILRPYFRFEPSPKHLTTKEGLAKCLVPPWTKSRLTKEVQLLTRQPTISPDGIQWTSISRDLTENYVPRVLSSGSRDSRQVDDASIEMKSDELTFPADKNDPLNPHILSYLIMLSRGSGQLKGSRDRNPGESEDFLHAIEGSLKLAQQIRFPQQSVASNLENGVPPWYDAMKRDCAQNPSAPSESSSIRSLSELTQVYGLSITHSQSTILQQPDGDENAPKEGDTAEAQLVESATAGEWGPECRLDPARSDSSLLVGKLKGLGVPSLPPRLGVVFGNQSARDPGVSMSEWKPKIDSLILCSSPTSGHTAPVSRLAVAYDQRFFVSGSYDGTCRVWELGQMEKSSGLLESSATYDLSGSKSNSARVNDVVILEQSHSIATAASDGNVHVWRVDLASSKGSVLTETRDSKTISKTSEYSRVSGTTEIRKLDSSEGEVLAVSHFNALSESVIVFATQRGAIHSWDLRSEREPFRLDHCPDLGSLSAMSLGNDRNWAVAGTSRGFLALWDIRFQKMVKVWHHSSAMPVSRLATTYSSFPAGARNAAGAEPRPFTFAACGNNECAMFDLIDGSCRQSFRVLDPEEAYGQHKARLALPALKAINLSSSSSRRLLQNYGVVPKTFNSDVAPLKGPTINAIVGSVGGFDQNFLITGGGDCHIRYWDFASPTKCFSVSGAVQQRPGYDRMDFQPCGRLMLCKHAPGPTLHELESSRVPRRQHRGIARPENRHNDAILDLKLVQLPRKAILSASRDSTIRIWR